MSRSHQEVLAPFPIPYGVVAGPFLLWRLFRMVLTARHLLLLTHAFVINCHQLYCIDVRCLSIYLWSIFFFIQRKKDTSFAISRIFLPIWLSSSGWSLNRFRNSVIIFLSTYPRHPTPTWYYFVSKPFSLKLFFSLLRHSSFLSS